MKKLSKVFLVCSLMVLGFAAKSGDRPLHEIHSMLMFNFIKYVEWPEAAKAGEFVIAVIGDDDVYNTINTFYAKRTVKGQTVRVISGDDASALNTAHVLYLSSKASKEFATVKSKFSGKPTLIITDKSGLGEKGSCINFEEQGGKLKFEINKAAFDANQLKVSSQLASMGIMI